MRNFLGKISYHLEKKNISTENLIIDFSEILCTRYNFSTFQLHEMLSEYDTKYGPKHQDNLQDFHRTDLLSLQIARYQGNKNLIKSITGI